MKDALSVIVNKEKIAIQSIGRLLKVLEKNREDPISNLDKIKEDIEKLMQYLQKSHTDEIFKKRIIEYIEEIKSNVPQWEEKRRNNFGFLLEEELSTVGLSLSGQYPLLKTYLFTIEVLFDEGKIILWYGPQQEKIGTSRLNVKEVSKKINNAYLALKERDLKDLSFLKTLYEAYRVLLFRKKKNLGEEMPILEVLPELAFLLQGRKFMLNPIKESFKSYGKIQFSYDLFLLKERQLKDVKLELTIATRSYTRKRSNFLWIPTDHKGNGIYVSHIRFREEV